MNHRIHFTGAVTLLLACHPVTGITEEDAQQAFTAITDARESEVQALESLPTDAEKSAAFQTLVEDASGNILSASWDYPAGGNWPLVDWNRVQTLESFHSDQTNWIVADEVFLDTAQELAQFQFAGALSARFATEGEAWFGEWLRQLAESPDSNLKWLVYWFTEDFGEDIGSPDQGIRNIDWNAWGQSFSNSNELGKAILLKNLTMLAARTGGWQELSPIHLSVFNGNNDSLKALALESGRKELGPAVTAKWEELAENSGNAKLKALAEEATQSLSDE